MVESVIIKNIAPGKWTVGIAAQHGAEIELSDCGLASLMLLVLRRFGYDGPIKEILESRLDEAAIARLEEKPLQYEVVHEDGGILARFNDPGDAEQWLNGFALSMSSFLKDTCVIRDREEN